MKKEKTPSQIREEVFKMDNHLRLANKEMLLIIEKVRTLKSSMESRLGNIKLSMEYEEILPSIILGNSRRFLCFVNIHTSLLAWENPTDIFRAVIYKEVGESIYDEKGQLKIPRPKRERNDITHNKINLRFKIVNRKNVWTDYETEETFITTDELIEQWINKFIEYMKKPSLKRHLYTTWDRNNA